MTPYRFCPLCGAGLVEGCRHGRIRLVCPSCDWVDYRNPGVGVAVVLRDDDGRLLLVRRGPEATRAGLWCIPCGYVDYGEEVRQAAARELLEETGLHAAVGGVLQVASNSHDPAKLSVGIWFEGVLTGGELRAGDDAVEVGWFGLAALPELAFETDVALITRLRSTGPTTG
jgi:ADP-ribose pyrophosphatase YjhB (NUDIX family)